VCPPTWCLQLVAQLTRATGPPERAGWLFCADQDCGLRSDFYWSHLWSHSCRFRGVRSGLPSLGSGGTRPNRTGLNHQPQNSKAREGQPSAGSNPAATALCTSSNGALAQAVNPVRSLNRSSRVDHAGDAVCHLSAIEGDSRKPPPQIEDSNCARRVDLPTGHILRRTRPHPWIHGHIRGLRRAV
jgi:hypothetical protein